MCGRYSQTADLKTLRERFGFVVGSVELKPRYNIAPSQDAPVIIDQGERRLELFHWGLIPSWAKDAAIGHRMINARAETLLEKPSFKRPFEKQRCLVVADGFYEWRQAPEAKTKIPTRIVLKSAQPFAMAGLWETWRDPAGGEIRSFTIITTGANGVLKPIHDRMPVILAPEDEGRWLDPKQPAKDLVPLLKPYRDDALETYRVSPIVNAPKNDTPQCVERVERTAS